MISPLLTILRHPFEGTEDIVQRKNGSFLLANCILALWVFSVLLDRFLTGFIFNTTAKSSVNVLEIIMTTLFLFLLFIIANWSICTLLDGKGRFKEIYIMCAYAFVPMIVFSLIGTAVSNFMLLEEGAFLGIIHTVGLLWSALLLFAGLMACHQYSFFKTLISIALTVIGIAIMLFLLVLVFSLFQQLLTFFRTIYREIIYKINR